MNFNQSLLCAVYAEHDQLLTLACKALHAEPPIPADISMPARWATAQDVVSECLAWAFRGALA
jgi:hypothetical protein